MEFPSTVDQLLDELDVSFGLPEEDRLLGISSHLSGIDLSTFQERLGTHQKVLEDKLGRKVHRAAALLDLLANSPEDSPDYIGNYCILKKESLKDLVQTALFDNLTGLYSRNILDSRLREEFQRALRYNLPLSVLFIDLDSFKSINDTFGHLEGNRVLEYIGKFISKQLREVDFPVRYGGEEFVIILPHTTGETALGLARRLHKAIERAQQREKVRTIVTLSIGVGTLTRDLKVQDQLIDAADRAVYHAKKAGKNMVWPIVNGTPEEDTSSSL